jgi:shikimate dehydrogenase
MVERYYLIGENVSASASPAMMNSAFAALGIEAVYEAENVAREAFDREFLRIRGDANGINVTIPYKSAVIPYLDRLDEVSQRIQAVNVVKSVGVEYCGYNTDAQGIIRPLEERHARGALDHALLLGAGGAARAFCEAMAELGCRRVTVAARDVSRAGGFASEMARVFPDIRFELRAIDDLERMDIQLLFNATPIGTPGKGLPEGVKRVIYGDEVVFDAVYRPMETELLKMAREMGCRTIGGHEMLLQQGVVALEIWTGRQAPVEVMKRALLGSLGAAD